MARCRKCGAEIFWIHMKKTGKMMPVNPELKPITTKEGKDIFISSSGDVQKGKIVKPEEMEWPDDYGYIPHWATCKYADQFRRRKPNAKRQNQQPQ